MAGMKLSLKNQNVDYRLESAEMSYGGLNVTLSSAGKPANTRAAEDMALEEARKTMVDPCLDATGTSRPQYNSEEDRSYVTIRVIDE